MARQENINNTVTRHVRGNKAQRPDTRLEIRTRCGREFYVPPNFVWAGVLPLGTDNSQTKNDNTGTRRQIYETGNNNLQEPNWVAVLATCLIKMYIVSCNLYAREEDTRLTLSSKRKGDLLWANVIFLFIYSIYTQQRKSRSLSRDKSLWMNRLGQLFDLDCPLPPPILII